MLFLTHPGTPITEIWINYPLNEKDDKLKNTKHITADWPNQNEVIGKKMLPSCESQRLYLFIICQRFIH